MYPRFHGPGRLFASPYSDEQLAEWAGRIKTWRAQGRDVYADFNNDVHGYALDNARTLARLGTGWRRSGGNTQNGPGIPQP